MIHVIVAVPFRRNAESNAEYFGTISDVCKKLIPSRRAYILDTPSSKK
jgi:hypothetical protein